MSLIKIQQLLEQFEKTYSASHGTVYMELVEGYFILGSGSLRRMDYQLELKRYSRDLKL
jgi:hypothetical protein